MRSYATDSPEASARIIVLAMLADGGLDKAELQLVDRSDLVQRLDMTAEEFDRIEQEFCEDVQVFSVREYVGLQALDQDTIDQLLGEVRSSALQLLLLRIILDMVKANGQLSSAELTLVSRAMIRWGQDLQTQSLHPDPFHYPQQT